MVSRPSAPRLVDLERRRIDHVPRRPNACAKCLRHDAGRPADVEQRRQPGAVEERRDQSARSAAYSRCSA